MSPLRTTLLAWLAIVMVALLAACDGDVVRGTLVQRGTFTVAEGERLEGILVLLDGVAVVDGEVVGTVVVLGGRLELEGRIAGDLTALSGLVLLGERAVIAGDLGVAGALERAPGAVVGGSDTVGAAVPAALGDAVRSDTTWWTFLGRILAFVLAAVVAARVWPAGLSRVAEAATRHVAVSAALGTLALGTGLVLVVAMAFTIVLIPLSLALVVAGAVALAFGGASLAFALGRAVARRRGLVWSPARSALVGSLALAPALALLEAAPALLSIVPVGLAVLVVGAVLLTGFGFRRFVPERVGDSAA
jgi:hypothetical protein